MHWLDERFERWWEDMEKTGDFHEMEQLRERLNGWLEKMDIQVQFRIDVWQDAQQEMGKQRCRMAYRDGFREGARLMADILQPVERYDEAGGR